MSASKNPPPPPPPPSSGPTKQELVALKAFCDKHNIRMDFILRVLQHGRSCKFVLICDDSSSMNTIVRPGPGAPPIDPFTTTELPTRWTELRNTCELVVELACTVTDSVDVHFLNNPNSLKGIKSSVQLHENFLPEARGSTPLAKTLRSVLQAYENLPNEKRLVILLATDGRPDGGAQGISDLGAALASKPPDSKVQILKITDDDAATAYLDKFDGAIDGVDVTDDYYSVLANVNRYRRPGTHFSMGDYIVKCLIGPMDKEIDEIDEPTSDSAPVSAPTSSIAHPVQSSAPSSASQSVSPDSKICVMCVDNPTTHAFSPCNHFCVCESCATGVLSSGKCPLCRSKIVGCKRVYSSV
jgi:hypothetical protein